MGREQRRLLNAARARETEERLGIQQVARAEQKQAREETPYSSWSDFLRWEVTQGHETALAILRSKDVDTHEDPVEDQKALGFTVREKWAQKQQVLLAEEGLSRGTQGAVGAGQRASWLNWKRGDLSHRCLQDLSARSTREAWS